jgi:hypothetical protein
LRIRKLEKTHFVTSLSIAAVMRDVASILPSTSGDAPWTPERLVLVLRVAASYFPRDSPEQQRIRQSLDELIVRHGLPTSLGELPSDTGERKIPPRSPHGRVHTAMTTLRSLLDALPGLLDAIGDDTWPEGRRIAQLYRQSMAQMFDAGGDELQILDQFLRHLGWPPEQ